MENSLLNKAHQARRKADKQTKKGLYAEATESHLEAARYFQKLADSISRDSLVVRSLEEQCKYHQRQAELTSHISKLAEKIEAKMAELKTVEIPVQPVKMSPRPAEALMTEIQRNFDEGESLIQILSHRKSSLDSTAKQSTGTKPAFTIRPKNDAEVIEELQTVNSNLRELVRELLEELKILKEEKLQLEKRLELYEPKPLPLSLNFLEAMSQIPDQSEIPELAPLEQPEFDFS